MSASDWGEGKPLTAADLDAMREKWVAQGFDGVTLIVAAPDFPAMVEEIQALAARFDVLLRDEEAHTVFMAGYRVSRRRVRLRRADRAWRRFCMERAREDAG